MALQVYNSLSRQKEEFKPINPDFVTMYLCGPTVYDYVSIGNYRTYLLGDILYRVLKFNDYNPKYVMNLTDVGHLTGDNLGDADLGDDRLEIAAEKEGKNARAVADFYIEDFFAASAKLNLEKPLKYTRATDYIQEQIDLVKGLEERGYTYATSDGIYFDTSKFPKYGELAGIKVEEIQENASDRLESVGEKRNPADFALWKFSPKDKIRWQEWDSPWGKGFPGWHAECSAMSITELGETLDFHLGGEDLKMVHHPNEIAQSECLTGKKFVNYWVHGAFLQVDGGRMGKSLGNAYTVTDVEKRGFNPLALRYFYFTSHYRSKLNFTWDALQSSQNSLKKLYDLVSGYAEDPKAPVNSELLDKFTQQINDDLNMPNALAVVWELMKSTDINEGEKLQTLKKFDEVLGLGIEEYIGYEVPAEVMNMAKTRWEYKKNNIWDKADMLRRKIDAAGFVVEDTVDGFKVKRKN